MNDRARILTTWVLVALTALWSVGLDECLSRIDCCKSPGSVVASPDGDTIAVFVWDPDLAVLLHDVDSGRSRTLAVPEGLTGLDWSPDGTKIGAMTSSSADRLVVVDVTTDEVETVTLDCGERCEFAGEGIQFGPQWPYAAITSEVDTWVVNVETGALRHVAADTWTIVAWQGSSIYFSRGAGQTDWPGFVLFRVPAEGGPEQRLLDMPPDCMSHELDPTGTFIVCEVDESRLDLWLVDGLGD